MVDSIALYAPGIRLADASGNVLAGGRIEFFNAGTTDEKTVYADADLETPLGTIVYLDSGGYPVNTEGGSTKVQVYLGIDPYKVVIYDGDGVAIATVDNIKGAFDSNAILATLTIIAQTEVTTLTSNTTLTNSDRGKLYNCNATGGLFTVTLPDATTATPGARFGFRMAGTANAVVLAAAGGQTVGRAGVASSTFSLTKLGETVWLVNSGGNWLVDTYVPPLFDTTGIVVIADRTGTPPSPAAGARYILTSSPTGAWSSFAQHDVAEADGAGGWFRYTPAADCGWLAYVQDEDEYYSFQSSAWVLLCTKAASASDMETATADNRAVTPAVQQRHPGHPKCWAYITYSGGTPTLAAGYNITDLVDNGVGDVTINIATDFSGTAWASVAHSGFAGGGDYSPVSVAAKAAGSIQLRNFRSGSGAVEASEINFAGFGDQ